MRRLTAQAAKYFFIIVFFIRRAPEKLKYEFFICFYFSGQGTLTPLLSICTSLPNIRDFSNILIDKNERVSRGSQCNSENTFKIQYLRLVCRRRLKNISQLYTNSFQVHNLLDTLPVAGESSNLPRLRWLMLSNADMGTFPPHDPSSMQQVAALLCSKSLFSKQTSR